MVDGNMCLGFLYCENYTKNVRFLRIPREINMPNVKKESKINKNNMTMLCNSVNLLTFCNFIIDYIRK